MYSIVVHHPLRNLSYAVKIRLGNGLSRRVIQRTSAVSKEAMSGIGSDMPMDIWHGEWSYDLFDKKLRQDQNLIELGENVAILL